MSPVRVQGGMEDESEDEGWLWRWEESPEPSGQSQQSQTFKVEERLHPRAPASP